MEKYKKYTKDSLINCFIESSNKTTEFMERISGVLEQLNDNNILHRQSLDVNTQATVQMTKAFNSFFNFFKIVFILIIAALVVLAGAEKAFQIFNVVKL